MNKQIKYGVLIAVCAVQLYAQEVEQNELFNIPEPEQKQEQEQLQDAIAPVKELLNLGGGSESLVDIGINETSREQIALRLNTLLANEYLLYIKTQKFHWNVVGPFFGQLHKLFNKQYDALAEHVDQIAERVRALGFKAFGTALEFTENGSIQENPGINPDASEMIKKLLADHETVIKQLADLIQFTHDANDAGTENFLAELLVNHQKMAWMLRAHLL